MFGLLKKKFKDFTDKVFKKTKEKVETEQELEESKKPNLEVTEEVSKTSEVSEVKEKYEKAEKYNEGLSKEKAIQVELKNTSIVGHNNPKNINLEKKKNNLKKSKEYESITSKKPEAIKKSIGTSLKSVFSSKIKLSEKEVERFLDDFEISLLEADVSISSSKAIIDILKDRLVNNSYSKSNLMEDLKKEIRSSLLSLLNIDCNIYSYIKNDKPLIIMFIGPNGAGKTTTISKFASMFKKDNKSIILASSDTFRAGSIDQLEKHANKIGVRIVKQNYGSDPAAVAYDAVASARANNIDYVLIDTAGRQDTNINLMQELKKIKKVVNPSLVIYVGEAQSGQGIVEQISKFDKEIGITGVVLTKIDTDPKGGVAISILNELKKPIFYIGVGQEYEDLVPFTPEYIINRIV